uniref:LRRCT domain-containing protein n=1 Tax=Nothoprocta perdicaria TaxID=30464 RepID=A0A8C6YY70_NOTPE
MPAWGADIHPALLLLWGRGARDSLWATDALVGLGALQELDLSNNYLTVLPSEAFRPLSSLVMLNLGSNRLGELEPKVLYGLPQLQVLILNSNPWVCTCSIQPLWHWLSLNREKMKGKCAERTSPSGSAGRTHCLSRTMPSFCSSDHSLSWPAYASASSWAPSLLPATICAKNQTPGGACLSAGGPDARLAGTWQAMDHHLHPAIVTLSL